MATYNEHAEMQSQQFQEIPPEITRLSILKADSKTLREWFRVFGATALNRRLQGNQ
jgi:hypothetical protein